LIYEVDHSDSISKTN